MEVRLKTCLLCGKTKAVCKCETFVLDVRPMSTRRERVRDHIIPSQSDSLQVLLKSLDDGCKVYKREILGEMIRLSRRIDALESMNVKLT